MGSNGVNRVKMSKVHYIRFDIVKNARRVPKYLSFPGNRRDGYNQCTGKASDINHTIIDQYV